MSTVDLKIAAINQLGNPAGTGMPEFQAATTGPESLAVWYKVDRNPLYEAVMGDDVRKAFLTADQIQTCRDASVSYKTRSDVENAGMGNYLLWLK